MQSTEKWYESTLVHYLAQRTRRWAGRSPWRLVGMICFCWFEAIIQAVNSKDTSAFQVTCWADINSFILFNHKPGHCLSTPSWPSCDDMIWENTVPMRYYGGLNYHWTIWKCCIMFVFSWRTGYLHWLMATWIKLFPHLHDIQWPCWLWP